MTYPEHIQWIIDNRSEALNQALLRDNSYKTIDNPLDVFLDADPTPKKKLTQWLVDTYIKGGFRWEDIQSGSKSKAFDTLLLYIKYKSKLDSSNRDLQVNANDIGQYNSLGSVYKDIAPFIKSDRSSRSAKRDDHAQAYQESEVLIKSESLTVVIPKTEYASKWWGKGTQWCTAGDNNNIFHDYFKNGPLIIIIINGVKTQLYIDLVDKDDSFQFMDEHDNEVNLKFIEDNWKLLSPIMEWVLKNNGEALQYVPEYLRTAELCLEAVRNNGDSLRFVNEDLRTEELCLEAVRQNGDALYYVAVPLRTAEVCLDAVRQNGRALIDVPQCLITPELCSVAVRSNGKALAYVPKNLITIELYLEAVKSNGRALYFVPKSLRKPELCLVAVKQNGMALGFVPKSLRTEKLCLEAVKKNGMALSFVPKSLNTPELCLEAIKQSGMALGFVPKSLRTEKLCLESVRQNGIALAFIPEPLKTPKLCLEAVRQSGKALCHVSESLRTAELCLDAVKQNSDALEYVPQALISPEILSCSKKDNVSYEKNWDYSVLEELKLQLNISNTLDNNIIFIK